MPRIYHSVEFACFLEFSTGKALHSNGTHVARYEYIHKLCAKFCMSCPPFTGNFVNRGYNSVGVMYLLACLVLLEPNHVFLTRGNHELRRVFRSYGFSYEVIICLMHSCTQAGWGAKAGSVIAARGCLTVHSLN